MKTRQLLTDRLWTTVKRIAARAKTRRGVIAYVSSDDFVKFGRGDLLITDATDPAISGGLTSAEVLERALKRGAALRSCRSLHAKVLLLEDVALIGSANASYSSARTLREAAWLTDEPRALRSIRSYLKSLEAASDVIDAAFVRRIKQIEVRPRMGAGTFRRPETPGRIHRSVLLFYKEVKEGDIKKYQAKSNVSDTGGGARDLRVSPATVFQPILQQMFNQLGPRLFVSKGSVYWRGTRGKVRHATIELWPPTKARDAELRIAKFYEVRGWNVTTKQFRRETKKHRRCFYVLEMDSEGIVWARIALERELDKEDRKFAAHVRNQLTAAPTGRAVKGVIDLVSGQAYP